MSSIERAVSRLAEARAEPADSRNDTGAGPAPLERKTTTEKLADRLGEAAPRPSPMAPPPETRTPDRTADHPEPVRIQLDAIRARGMVAPDGSPTPSAHEFRIIKRPLVYNAFGRPGQPAVQNGRRIMVTSAFPGEGKTFCAINLAMSIAAERDRGVILVDADVARPSIPRELGIQVQAGLMEWLLGEERDLTRLVRPTNVDTLSLLPAGRRHEQATELLASESMGRLLDRLSESYPECLFIFDSPPLLVTTEARVLASYMGQVVMVVEAGKTPREAVTQALATIESNEIIGLVLNKAQDIESGGYYQGYGYGPA